MPEQPTLLGMHFAVIGSEQSIAAEHGHATDVLYRELRKDAFSQPHGEVEFVLLL